MIPGQANDFDAVRGVGRPQQRKDSIGGAGIDQHIYPNEGRYHEEPIPELHQEGGPSRIQSSGQASTSSPAVAEEAAM